MPEYLAPGVYITEIATGARPIEGVSTSTANLIGTVEMMRPLFPRLAPGWTDHNTHDPGVTLLSLFAWLTESLIYRDGELSEHGKRHAARLAAAALALVADCEQPHGSVLRKVRFFAGRRLNDEDMQTEQKYLRPRDEPAPKSPAHQSTRIISRQWRGLARPERAREYEEHLETETFPKLRQIPGFIDASILRRQLDQRVEFVVVTQWKSLEAIARFAGSDVEAAVVPPKVEEMMIDYDRRVRHFEAVEYRDC